jgi:adenylate cyclase
MPPDAPALPEMPRLRTTFDDALGRRIVELHVWAVREGLRGRVATCRRALDAAGEAMLALDALNAARAARGKPVAAVDLALHLGEVLYGNVGAADRLDFTVIGPAVNEVARVEALCEALDRQVLVSAELATAAEDGDNRLEPLGRHRLRGVREEQEIFALVVDSGVTV